MSGERGLDTGLRRRDFLGLMAAGAAGLMAPGLACAAPPARRQPNIVVIIADDLGYADLGCQGGDDIPTPHIDSLARSGVRFTSGYVSGPVCSPTRAGVMTGRYQQRFGHEFNPGANPESGLALTETTIADTLKGAGYATGAVGKWHLGGAARFHPLRRGFDEFFGFLGGGHSYVDARADSANPILRGTERVDEPEYLTDAFSREAVAFIARRRRAPFFLYLSYNAVHTPMQATPEYLDRFRHIAQEQRRTYAAMLSAMDDGVGRVLGELRRADLEHDTLVFFFSDNGGPTAANSARNDPLSGVKGMVAEGGVRVPFLMQWPARIAAGRTYDQPVVALDVLPTAVAAAGGELPGDRVIDGVDLLPHLSGERQAPPHAALYWRSGQQRAIRKGDWKFMRIADDEPELYSLAADIGESDNLARERPELAEELTRDLAEWESQLAQPRWERPAQGLRRRARRLAPAR